MFTRSINSVAMRYAAVISFAALTAPSAVAEFPDKPIRALVGYSAGGVSDFMMRVVGAAASPLLGQSVVIENRPGANGILAAQEVARSPADGHTVYQCPMSPMVMAPQLITTRTPFDPGVELTPVANIVLSSYGLAVAPESKIHRVSDLVAVARAESRALTSATAGTGSAQHLAGELLKRRAKIDITHIPYRGSAPAITDLLAGRVDFMFSNYSDIVKHVSTGKLRLVAQGDPSVFPAFPNVPRIADTIPGVEVAGWFGLCVPKGTPEKAVARWAQVMEQVMKDPAVQQKLRDGGLTPHYESPTVFTNRIKAERATWLTVIKEGNVQAE